MTSIALAPQASVVLCFIEIERSKTLSDHSLLMELTRLALIQVESFFDIAAQSSYFEFWVVFFYALPRLFFCLIANVPLIHHVFRETIVFFFTSKHFIASVHIFVREVVAFSYLSSCQLSVNLKRHELQSDGSVVSWSDSWPSVAFPRPTHGLTAESSFLRLFVVAGWIVLRTSSVRSS